MDDVTKRLTKGGLNEREKRRLRRRLDKQFVTARYPLFCCLSCVGPFAPRPSTWLPSWDGRLAPVLSSVSTQHGQRDFVSPPDGADPVQHEAYEQAAHF